MHWRHQKHWPLFLTKSILISSSHPFSCFLTGHLCTNKRSARDLQGYWWAHSRDMKGRFLQSAWMGRTVFATATCGWTGTTPPLFHLLRSLVWRCIISFDLWLKWQRETEWASKHRVSSHTRKSFGYSAKHVHPLVDYKLMTRVSYGSSLYTDFDFQFVHLMQVRIWTFW